MIQPATKEDPNYLGMKGTINLRESNDIYNEMLTFSILYQNIFNKNGYNTLDIECDTDLNYFILIHGFYLLYKDNLLKIKQINKEINEKNQKKLSLYENIEWFRNQLFINNQNSMKYIKSDNPIDALYDPIINNTNIFDIFHMTTFKTYNNNNQTNNSHKDLTTKLPIAQFLGWKTAGTQIWARLIMSGLIVKPIYSWNLKSIILKIKCPQWKLEEIAEFIHLKLKNRDGTIKKFKISKRDTFLSIGSDGKIFRSSERQQIIDFIIKSKIKDGGAELNDNSILG